MNRVDGRAPPSRAGDRWLVVTTMVAALALVAVIGYLGFARLGTRSTGLPGAPARAGPTLDAVPVRPAGPVDLTGLVYRRTPDPPGTTVQDAAGRSVAVFTDGARSVLLHGQTRRFAEPTFTRATVTTDAWIRLAPQAWAPGAESAGWFAPWFTAALADTGPDALAVAMDYVTGAPTLRDGAGVRYAGDADFGPYSDTDPDGRAENADFFDYLGVRHAFPDGGRSAPQSDRLGDLDCSGYLRMVYGYRLGYPLRSANTAGTGLPRRAFAMARFGPGVPVIADNGTAPQAYDRLQPGDLVFFNLDPSDGALADHSGIYLGRDDAGHHRFVSSRSKANGPTFGDYGGAAILDGGGHFSALFRSARRL